ncbi:PTS transporter subunit EIIC [Shewanella yunxiaonensis]|uniref:PTS transporter subunit EIIC n=1 Tax=Shewanella yunxiaonensis TaxID=2829809 RepID=A0ABX7YQK7_9GAMM|nr:PTS transporter subunit EIIC [Shewanella yunxiaonensis]QUN04889.1 PTS transporter subunit EIIC [Shewanella yunxiaonensis]
MAEKVATTGRLSQSANWLNKHWFKFAQNLSQALLTPIAILPAAGLMIGLAGTLSTAMPPLLFELLSNVGNFIFAMMPLLFAVAIAVGFCREQGAAAISAVFGYGVFTAGLGVLVSDKHLPGNMILGINTLDTGIAGGMVLGGLTCLAVYLSRFVKLPSVLSFFEGRRSGPLLMLPLALLMAWVFSYLWPPLAHYIQLFSDWAVYQKPQWAFALYGTVERLLLPLGLHHIWNAPFFLEFGQYSANGEIVRGEIARYLAGDPQAGNLAGGYLIKMWGLPAAAFAMWRCADKTERNRVAGIMLSAAATSWFTGVTEPIEFAFLFVAPVLYLLHALLCGLAYLICVLLNIHYGVSFSQGALDLVLMWHNASNAGWFLILGPLTAVLYYTIFSTAIVIFNLKTPGRMEPDELHKSMFTLGIGESADTSRLIIHALGGAANIHTLGACMTRLRLNVVDPLRVDKSQLLALGAKGVIVMGQGVQVVFGTKAEAMRRIMQQHLDSGIS